MHLRYAILDVGHVSLSNFLLFSMNDMYTTYSPFLCRKNLHHMDLHFCRDSSNMVSLSNVNVKRKDLFNRYRYFDQTCTLIL